MPYGRKRAAQNRMFFYLSRPFRTVFFRGVKCASKILTESFCYDILNFNLQAAGLANGECLIRNGRCQSIVTDNRNFTYPVRRVLRGRGDLICLGLPRQDQGPRRARRGEGSTGAQGARQF